MKLINLATAALPLMNAASGFVIQGKPTDFIKPYEAEPLQDIVTWDEHSLFVHGERILFYSGEFHPFRLPVPGLWLDVFQKIKSLGYNGVSFYTAQNLHESEEGVFRADGIFALEPFFEAASQAGIYLLARPGPYINAEEFGGGFPGWMTRINGEYRTNDTAYIQATDLYTKEISKIIAKAQITNGGPVILLQPENEYTNSNGEVLFPNRQYFYDVEQQFRDNGIVVPLINNDASPKGYFAPGTGLGSVDIYGYDGYPLGFDCSNPGTWPDQALPTNFETLHRQQNPTTPNSIIEFQGGSFDPWGGVGFAKCASLLNTEFENVFYKNLFGSVVTIFNIYMTYGGTNWGNLGHPGGYTSYDYAAVIREDRAVDREKYSAAKLLAQSLQASPEYLTAVSTNTSMNGSYTNNPGISVWPSHSNKTGFWVVRHSAYNSRASTSYKLKLPTSQGNLTIPQIGTKSLTLNGRDAKLSVTDYPVGAYDLLYSSADIFTWKKDAKKTVLVVYGGLGEQHELAFTGNPKASVLEGSGAHTKSVNGAQVINWSASSKRSVVQIGNDLYVYFLSRNAAYNYWVVDAIESTPSSYGSSPASANYLPLVLSAGYLIRNATYSGSTLAINGDLNATAPLEIVAGAPSGLKKLTFNGADLPFKQSSLGVVTSTLKFTSPKFMLPDLSKQKWSYINSLPEIQSNYSDALWTSANNTKTPNIEYPNLLTPTSLYSNDYGYHVGTLLYRGHFTSDGTEQSLFLYTQGGYGYGVSVWLNSTYVGSFTGSGAYENHNDTFSFPKSSAPQKGKKYVLTVVVDTTGMPENYGAGDIGGKAPRGILNYKLGNRAQNVVSWKLTGNLGGEKYIDKTRGPLNEGGIFAERQGLHLPAAPTTSTPALPWSTKTPYQGISAPGIGYFYTSFNLSIPKGYDIPLAFVFTNQTTPVQSYRAELFVNGYQFGKYVANVGPQTSFPVPEGIMNHRGENYVGLVLWAQQEGGVKVPGLKLVNTNVVQTGYGDVPPSPQPPYIKRAGAY